MRIEPGNELAVRLVGLGGSVEAQVSGVVRVVFPCDRCLEPAESALRVRFTERFAEPDVFARMPAPVREGEEDGVTWSPIEDHAIDLFPALLRSLLLAAPAKHLCRPGCLGLCPVCGKDLNEGPCACRRERGDPRLEALADVLRDLPDADAP
ncbi:MAG: DUF177 domain-containing protein [Clostridia bacterium]|nr:DUF177 domain-containing protein [Clostridia bacterium]